MKVLNMCMEPKIKKPHGRPRGLYVYPDREEADLRVRFSRARAQAHMRDETWRLTFEEWVAALGEHRNDNGRGSYDYALIRLDRHLGWSKENVICETRMFQNRYRYLRDQNPDIPTDRVVELTRKSIQDEPRSIQQRRRDRRES